MVAAAPSIESDPDFARRRFLTFVSVVVAGTTYASAVTVANAVLPQMQGDLSVGLDQISWVVTASIVAGAIGMPVTPWLAQRFGPKQLLIASLVAFTFASTMIGLSSSIGEVVTWRILQALAGAPILALSQIFTINAYPEEKRGMAMAWWSIGLTCGWVFAPTVGAYLAEQGSWQVVFFLFAPAGLLSIALCVAFVPATDTDATLEFDWFGFFALSIALLGLQVVLNRGQRLDWFDSSQIVVWALIGGVAFYLFVTHSMTTRKPFIDWGVFRDRNFSVGILLTMTFSLVSFTPLVLVPAMLQQLRGVDVETIGLIFVPRGAIQLVVMLMAAPLIGRVDSRLLISSGFVLYAIGSGMMAGHTLEVGEWDMIWPLTLQGMGMSIIWLPVFHMMYLTLAERYRTNAAALLGLAHSLSSSAGVAIAVTLLTRTSQTANAELAAHVVPTNELLNFPQYRGWDLEVVESVAAIQSEVSQQALMIGYSNVYWLLTWVCVGAVAITLVFGSSGRKAPPAAA